MDKLIIGRYIVGDSFIHRLDPRSKLLAMLIYIVIIFWANNPLTYAVITLFTLFLVFLSKIKLGFFLGGIKPISCAGTLKTVKGFKSDSTASDKLKGVVVRVSRVEKLIMRINLRNIIQP